MSEYADWEEVIERDQQSGRRASGKKWGLLYKIPEVKVKLHLQRPEKPYLHPTNGAPLPFRVGEQHYIPFGGKKKRGASVECGDKLGEPCIVHAYVDPVAYGLTNIQPQPKLDKKGARPYYAVSAWVEEPYHLNEYWLDPNNQAKGTFKRREPCEGRGCESCAAQAVNVFGNKVWFSASPPQWLHSFHNLNKVIENRHCRCGGSIVVPSFSCKNCKQLLVDVSLTCTSCHRDGVEIHTDTGRAVCPHCRTDWSADYTDHPKILEQVTQKMKCACGTNEKPAPNRMCSNETCTVDPLGVFDCQLTVHCELIKRPGNDIVERRIMIDEYVIQDPDPRLFDPQFQGGDAMAVKIAENMKKPLDLNHLLRCSTPDDQAKELNMPNPFTLSGKVSGAGQYPKFGHNQAPAEEATAYAAAADEDVPY